MHIRKVSVVRGAKALVIIALLSSLLTFISSDYRREYTTACPKPTGNPNNVALGVTGCSTGVIYRSVQGWPFTFSPKPPSKPVGYESYSPEGQLQYAQEVSEYSQNKEMKIVANFAIYFLILSGMYILYRLIKKSVHKKMSNLA